MSSIDHGAVRVTATGVGLIGFMVGWLLLNRISDALLSQPTAAWLAMAGAVACGGISGVVASRRLLRRLTAD